jgi:hypothetical protein
LGSRTSILRKTKRGRSIREAGTFRDEFLSAVKKKSVCGKMFRVVRMVTLKRFKI